MGYAPALEKAWKELSGLGLPAASTVMFLNGEYAVDPVSKIVLSVSCNVSAKDHYTIIILHYLIHKLRMGELPPPAGEWIDFRQIDGGEGYYASFKKRTIDVIARKYGERPEQLMEAAKRLNGKEAALGDIGVVIEAFQRVPVGLVFWKGDEEFAPEANILFDRGITSILCTEDIVVMTEIIAHSL
ncbi:MAG: DUF3786 domain-containing protein [Candidatus Omnitrophota bacterium]